jgi:hypothetical protein
MPALPPGLRTLIRVVRALTAVGALAMLAVPLIFWTHPDWVRQAAPEIVGLGRAPIVVDDRALLLGGLGSLPAIALWCYALWQLWRLFGEFGAGRVFAAGTQEHLRRFAWAVLVSALLVPLHRAWIGVALTFGNPPGQRMLVLGFSWNDYLAMLLGAVLLAVATVFADAVRLAQENEGFV